jgi:acetolactate synthase-1/2/3 large subunit
MSPAEAIRTIDSLLAQDDIVIEEATTNAGAVRAGLRRTVPGTLFHPGGSGLGWGLGGALGARLAAPDQRIVAIVGDGSFLFSNPAPALWAARSARAPFLVVVLQNGGYAASRRPVFDLFPDGFSADLGDVVGTRFDGPPDFAAIAEACGAFGGYVETPGDLLPTMKNALAAVDSGSCAVVVVPVTSAWFAAAEDSPV